MRKKGNIARDRFCAAWRAIRLCLPLMLAGDEALHYAALSVWDNALCRQETKQQKYVPTRQEILEAEQRLYATSYWTGPVDGQMDGASRHALIAFQKVEGLRRDGELSRAMLEKLRVAARPLPLETGYFHIEIDLRRQVLFLVGADGLVSRVLPVSSGNGKLFTSQGRTRRAVTSAGRFRVYQKIAGWRKSPLGMLYYPNYIHHGIAIHGSLSVPVNPASHGCIRIPMYGAKELSEMIPIGTPVIVYEDAHFEELPED